MDGSLPYFPFSALIWYHPTRFQPTGLQVLWAGEHIPATPYILPQGSMNLSRSEFLFNAAAILSLGLSIVTWFLGFRLAAIFVGLWVPSILGWMNFAAIKESRKLRGGD